MNKPILTNLGVVGSTHTWIIRMLAQLLHNFSSVDVLVLCNHIMIYHSFNCPPKAITHTFAMSRGGIYPHNGTWRNWLLELSHVSKVAQLNSAHDPKKITRAEHQTWTASSPLHLSMRCEWHLNLSV